MIRTAAGVLAGGKSSRMGSNKASLSWNGTTFLDTVLAACQDFQEIYLSVDDSSKYEHLPYPVLEDEKKEYGPLEGIYQILKTMEADYALILATDMPMVDRDFLRDFTEQVTGEEDCLVLCRDGRPQPLCSIYSKRLLPLLEKMREEGEHKPGLLFGRAKSRQIELSELGYGYEVVENVNTPEEYAVLCMNRGRHLAEFAPAVKRALAGSPVLICYLDGLGYFMYQKAFLEGKVPFLKEHFRVLPVRSVEPPVTNPAMATMLTGVLPKEHGVLSRRDRELSVPTFFAGRTRENTAFLEGDTRILKTELPPKLHAAGRGEGCDSLIFSDAMKAVEDGKELIFAHFHEIDDMAHTYGPYGDETMEQITRADEYIRQLSERFSGTFLLISDHGIHSWGTGGGHGTLEGREPGDYYPEDLLAIWGGRYGDS